MLVYARGRSENYRAGIREYDFLGGIGRHKRDWGAVEKTSTRVVMARRTSVSRGVFELPAVEVQTRESVRRFIPQAVLDFANRRLSAKPRSPQVRRGRTIQTLRPQSAESPRMLISTSASLRHPGHFSAAIE